MHGPPLDPGIGRPREALGRARGRGRPRERAPRRRAGRQRAAPVRRSPSSAHGRGDRERRLLSTAATLLSASPDLDTALDRLAHLAVRHAADHCAIVADAGLDRDPASLVVASRQPSARELFEELRAGAGDREADPLAPLLERRRPVLVSAATDEQKLRSILRSLLDNAVAFTERGGVRLEVTRRGDAARSRVIDAGVGIAASEHARIFEPYWQGDRGLTRGVSGTGVGLAIADRLARMLGGRIELRSRPGEGSTSTVTLPLADETGTGSPRASDAP